MSEVEELPTLIFVRDLLFSSRIVSAAKDADRKFRVVRDISILQTLDGTGLIVDLNQEGFLDAASMWRTRTGKSVTGFVSHVDAATIAKSRELGIDRVMTKGQFTAALPTLFTPPTAHESTME